MVMSMWASNQVFQEVRELTGILLSVYLREGNSVVDALLPRFALEREEWFHARLRDWR